MEFILMFKNIFDLSFERNLEEALVFYFCYIVFCYYIVGLCFCLSKIFYSDFLYLLLYITPFIFYTFLSIYIIFKKSIRDFGSICLAVYSIVITLFTPIVLLFFLEYLVKFKDMTRHDILWGLLCTFFICLFPSITLGGIPVAILTTKEDHSIKNEIKKMEKEKLEHEQRIEKQLLTERVNRSKLEEIKKQLTNNEEKEISNED